VSTDLPAFLFRSVTSPRHFPPTSSNQKGPAGLAAWKHPPVAKLNRAPPCLSLLVTSSNTYFLPIWAAARHTRGNTKEKREGLREPAR
ncbi:unnamed protein product, partial [Ectocarpus sp. 4 AP-2014]